MKLTSDYQQRQLAPQRLVTSGEWRLVLGVTLLVLVLTNLPYLYGYWSTPEDKQFMGLIFNVPDHAQYFSWYRDFETANFVSNRMTPEPSQPLFFNLLWWILARLGFYTGLSYVHMFTLLRLVATIAFLFMVYYFCAYMLSDIWERKVAFLLITFASGLGWFLVVLKYTLLDGELLFPIDVFKAGTNSFWSMMAFPHFTMANALILGVFALMLISYEQRQLKYAWAAGLVAAILGWQHVYDLITVYGVLGVFFALETIRLRAIPWQLVKAGLILGLLSVSTPFYALYLTNLDPTWREVLDQFDNAGVFTPTPFHMIIVVGFTLLVAVFTFDGFTPLQEKEAPELFIKTWFLTSFFLAYLPVGYQVHLTNLWQVPVAILATVGLCRKMAPYLAETSESWGLRFLPRQQVQYGLALSFVVLASLTSIYLFLWRFVDLSRHEYSYYLHQEEITALTWLEENSKPGEVAFSSLTIGQYIPVLTDAHTFLGHWAQTLDFFDKTLMVEKFFGDELTDQQRQQLLQHYSVDYVFYGPAERTLGAYNLENASFLQEAYTSPQVTIYKVQQALTEEERATSE